MKLKYYLVITVTVLLTACGGSSSSGTTSMLTTTTSENLDSGTFNGFDSIDVSTVVNRNDVYIPNNLPTNECSSPFWESYSGIYQGTISILDTSQADTSLINDTEKTIIDCNWDVEISLKRRYYGPPPVTRSFCEFEAYIDVQAYAAPESYIERWENSEGEPQERTINYLECAPMTRTVDLSLSEEEPELSNPTFPNTVEIRFETVFMENGLGKKVNIVPGGTTVNNSISEIDLTFDGSGGITLPAATRIEPVWFANISKVKSDLDP